MSGMVTKDIIQSDLKTAMKNGERKRVSTIRFLLAAVKNREIDLGRPIDSSELIAVINSGIKKSRESLESFEKGGRVDLADEAREEMAILEAYLPPPLDEKEVEALIEEAVIETGARNSKDIGAVMKWIIPKTTGRADGRLISQKVKAKLS